MNICTMDLKIIGKINFRTILYLGVIEVLVTVVLCYTLTVTQGHEPAWLPTISECGAYPPEKYFFRWGIMVGGILLVTEAVILHLSEWISSLEYYLGVIAGVLLTGVAIVAHNENYELHMIFALGFFLLEDIMLLLMLSNSYKSMTYRSLAVRISSTAVTVAATVVRFLIEFGFIHIPAGIPLLAILEWINVGAIIVFHLTLSYELHHLYLAGLEDESSNKKKATTSQNDAEVAVKKTPL